MKAAINSTLLRNLPTENVDIRDTKLKGFILRARTTGAHSYLAEYARGKKKTLGSIYELKPAQARELAEKVFGDVAHGKDPMAAKREERAHTWKSFLKQDYEPWVTANRRDGRGAVVRLRAHFGEFDNKKLKDVTPWAIEKWRSKRLKAGKAPSTVNRDIATLKSALAKAVEWGFVGAHPLKAVKLQRVDDANRVRFLKNDEAPRLREALDARQEKLRNERDTANQWRRVRKYQELPDLRAMTFCDNIKPLVLLALNTGLRRGELFNLHWQDVDLDRATLRVKGSGAKSAKSRHVPLNAEALSALKAWHEQNAGSDYVFPARDGGRLDNVNKAWRHLTADAKLIDFHFHDLRHNFASKLVMAGVDLNTVRELLGHADIAMTLRYAHLAPERKAAAVAKLAAPPATAEVVNLWTR